MNTSPRTSFSPPTPPPDLATLPVWACWRTWSKNGRVTREPVHHSTGKNLRAKSPAGWSTYDEVVNSRGRKGHDGVGLLVRKQDGLDVLRHATAGQVERLGAGALYVGPEADGGGLVVVVRAAGRWAGKKDAKWVPLSGNRPCQRGAGPNPETRPETNPETNPEIGAASGNQPYQQNGQSGNRPCQQSGPNPETGRAIFSSSHLPKNNNRGDEEKQKPVGVALADYGRSLLAQGKASAVGQWLYGVISILQVAGLKMEEVNTALLREFSDIITQDADEVWAKVTARWAKLDPARVMLADAYRAVLADPTLTAGLPYNLSEPARRLAGMCRWMGSANKPFRLHQQSLAQVMGLSNQQSASDLVLSLLNLNLMSVWAAPHYSKKKEDRKAGEYIWIADGALVRGGIRPAAPVAVTPSAAPSKTPTPPPAPAPLPPQPAAPARPRPAWVSDVKDDAHPHKSFFHGGFVPYEHHAAEAMMNRKYGKAFDPLGHGAEYQQEADRAKELIGKYDFPSIVAVLTQEDNKRISSLVPDAVEQMVRAEFEDEDDGGFSEVKDDIHRHYSAVRKVWLDAENHYAEVVLERWLKKVHKRKLFRGYWDDPAAGPYFERQVELVRGLAEKYSFKAVRLALGRPDAKNAYTFSAPWFVHIVEQEQGVLDNARARAARAAEARATRPAPAAPEPAPATTVRPTPRPAFAPKKSMLSNLARA